MAIVEMPQVQFPGVPETGQMAIIDTTQARCA
jgi:hypothetical protein